MKKLLTLFAFALVVLISQAATQINGIYYVFDNSTQTAYVTSNPNKYSGSIIIPSTVTYNDKSYSVTSIGDRAFYECSDLTSIDIPNSVTSIGSHAFFKCSKLTSIIIPTNVTSIGKWAFAYCSKLADITIPNSVTSIENNTFYQCTKLSSIIIPNSVTNIGYEAFYFCSNLTTVTFSNSVTSIGSYAFKDCKNLTSVTFSNSVTSIGSYAFENCSNLKKVNISDIAAWCNITFSSSLSNPLLYAENLYIDDEQITDLTIPNSVTSIKDYAFEYCEITSVTIPNSVTSIGTEAFSNCLGLTSIDIPNSVTSIGNGAFQNCSNLISVSIDKETPISISQKTFTNRFNATLYVPTGSKSAYLNAEYWKEFYKIIDNDTTNNALKGDVNGDGEVTTTDIAMIVNYILGIPVDCFNTANADIHENGEIDINDVVATVNSILGNNDGNGNGNGNGNGEDDDSQAHISCPDGAHPHKIDLGLPSGTIWACCNIGTYIPSGAGMYYAWGETEEKTVYNDLTYQYCSGEDEDGDGFYDNMEWDNLWHGYNFGLWQNIGRNIAGTQYDVAHVKWGGKWKMPSGNQIQEMIDNCSFIYTSLNGVEGCQVTGKNGRSIFLPLTGVFKNDELIFNDQGFYLASTMSTWKSDGTDGIIVGIWESLSGWHAVLERGGTHRSYGVPVRPVWVP